MTTSSERDHQIRTSTKVTVPPASSASAASQWPPATAAMARMGSTGGTQLSVCAHGRSGATAVSWLWPANRSRWRVSGSNPARANSKNRRSRPFRDRSAADRAVTSARDSATQTASSTTAAATMATVAAGEEAENATAAPPRAIAVPTAAGPTSDAASRPVMSSRRDNGNSARRVGSSVSSLPKPSSGPVDHPTTSTSAPISATTARSDGRLRSDTRPAKARAPSPRA